MSLAPAQINPDVMLMELAADCASDPLSFAKGFWPDTEPRTWQAEILAYIRDWLKDPKTRHQPCRIAVASGHDIGKSALVAMIEHWALATCSGCMAVTTAGSGKQLETKTVPETMRWFRRSIAAHWFDIKAESIRCNQTPSPGTWRLDFITWNADNPEPFQGLHNLHRRILLIFDEASAVDQSIWTAAQGSLTDEDTEIIWLVFGNPTRNTGAFRECFGSQKHRWKTFQIDSRNVEGTNKQEIARWIEDYGEDSDYVRIKVRGEFPRAASGQWIGSDVVAACRKYRATGYESLPKILSVDVARFGDDQTVIGIRQGRKLRILGKYRGKDTTWTAEQTIAFMQQEKPNATVIDGDGLGAGVVDACIHRGFNVFEFHGGGTPMDGAAYYNKRAECWGAMRDWLGAGAEIPDDPELEVDLTSPEYGFSSKNQVQLERKEDMKKRGLNSPDCGDMLAMTFGVKVAPPIRKSAPLPRVGAWS